MVDDVLDYTAEESALGKPIGGDLREGKVTLPVILLLRRTGPDVTALVAGRRRERARDARGAGARSRTALRRHGAVDEAFDRAVHLRASAPNSTCATAFPPSLERDGLIALADYVLSRDR